MINSSYNYGEPHGVKPCLIHLFAIAINIFLCIIVQSGETTYRKTQWVNMLNHGSRFRSSRWLFRLIIFWICIIPHRPRLALQL